MRSQNHLLLSPWCSRWWVPSSAQKPAAWRLQSCRRWSNLPAHTWPPPPPKPASAGWTQHSATESEAGGLAHNSRNLKRFHITSAQCAWNEGDSQKGRCLKPCGTNKMRVISAFLEADGISVAREVLAYIVPGGLSTPLVWTHFLYKTRHHYGYWLANFVCVCVCACLEVFPSSWFGHNFFTRLSTNMDTD